MSGMQALLKEVYEKNASHIRDLELGFDQQLTKGSPPAKLLMIDGIHHKNISPQMKALYQFAIKWKCAVFGIDIVDPNSLNSLYARDGIRETIGLVAENYRPIPPSDTSDWQRTALFAIDDAEQSLCLYWWRRRMMSSRA